MTDIEIMRHELDDIKERLDKLYDIKERLDKLEAQFTFPTSLSSDWNYVKENPWLDYNDTSNDTSLSIWSNNDKN